MPGGTEMPMRHEMPGAGRPQGKKPRFTSEAAAERMRTHERREAGEVARRSIREYKAAIEAERTPEVMVGEATKEEAREIRYAGLMELEGRIASLEVSIDDLRAAHASNAELQRKIAELMALQQARDALETETRETVGTDYREHFEADLVDAEQDQQRKLAAQDYKELTKQRDWIERELKKRTGHGAEEIDMDASLTGSAASRFGERVRGWFARLAGTEAEATSADLMAQWRKVSGELEELSRTIQPSIGDAGVEMRAKALHTRADEDMASKAALDREEARRRQEIPVEVGPQLRIVERQEEMQALMGQINALDGGQLLERQEELTAQIAGLEKALKAEATTGELDATGKEMLQDAWETLERLRGVYDDTYADLAEQVRKAPKGKRAMGIAMGGRRDTGGKTYGTEAMGRQARPEVYAGPGPKTELGVEEEAAMEANTYRAEHAGDIKRVMTELTEAAAIWDSMSKTIAKLSPEKRQALVELFGTKDIATAYVLNAADYQIEARYAKQGAAGAGKMTFGETVGLDASAKASQERVIAANRIMGMLMSENLEAKLVRVEEENAVPLTKAKKPKGSAAPAATPKRKKAANG